MATRRNAALVFLVLTAAVAVLHVAEGASYVVGDSTGWNVPSATTFYSSWASNLNFSVGDTLVFNFATGAHDVATVNKDAFDNCAKSNPLSLQTAGPANLTLSSTGDHYFICTIASHCSSGQKLTVNVKAASGSPSPTSSPPPPPSSTMSPPPPSSTTSPPPPPPSSASSLAATFSVVLMTIALTMFNLS
ncbi:hypothetical protein I3843_03G228800 [Carya illinoinensis]|uniref:Phytocyanin domain-containing protein n=1 Tax=Carya illinoinensis TaxID=32201 RepID=A0A8T1R5R4_CARIL|nr:umecyanin-like [Carya illinoinensis]KAG2718782.1 hypothetical protein I3760_03G236900 [Carya illinoinensis]KAG6662488.1 hypothetical protein CIPAW_03G246100 [Carya illinoinensis]KAG6723957.1 hypothetical protein I3842_03G234400 [Carya illinoinensis]KAG7989247.1 hypothetical protein I3843_03G228800 [Carya illinoinensis]